MLTGIGMYIWKVENCETGKIDSIVKMAVDMHFSHVLLKIADGRYSYNAKYAQPLTAALRAAGIQVWGWQYAYGDRPTAEALNVIPIIQALDVDGFVVNAEAEYKRTGFASRARDYMKTLRAGVGGNFPIALSSYRWPSYHREFPWAAFLEYCDLAMPQVYWLQAHNPTAQLQRTLSEYAKLEVQRPVFPTGACFREYGWQPTAAEVAGFITAAKDAGLNGVNFWEWGNARSYVMDGWEVIRSASWANPPAPITDPAPIDGMQMRVLVEGLRVRTAPVIEDDNIAASLSKGDIVRIANISGSNVWAQLANGNWVAVQIGSMRYMERVDA